MTPITVKNVPPVMRIISRTGACSAVKAYSFLQSVRMAMTIAMDADRYEYGSEPLEVHSFTPAFFGDDQPR